MISRSISRGLAPGHKVVTVISGLSTSGANCIGRLIKATMPNRSRNMTPTEVDTG